MKWVWISPRIFLFFLLAFVLAAIAEFSLPSSTFAHAQISTQPEGRTSRYYLALGDSLAFGYQPDKDFTHGYTDLLAGRLQKIGFANYADMGCPGETSSTMLGQCPQSQHKYPYQGSQLQAAVDYIKQHPGLVNVVTLTIGANDTLPFIDPKTCQIDDAGFNNALSTLDTNLRKTILPRLNEALKVNGKITGRILLTNYYNPFQNICPKSTSYIQTLNTHLANDVRGQATLVDVFRAFGGSTTPNPRICTYTWICSSFQDIHPTDQGYKVIADAVARRLIEFR